MAHPAQKAAAVLLTALTLFSPGLSVGAAAPEEGYCYNSYDESVPAPAGYQYDRMIYGSELEEKTFGLAQDMAAYNGELYVLNNKQGTVSVLTADLEYLRSIHFTKDGQEQPAEGASGLFLETVDGKMQILVADTEKQRIFRADAEGRILQEYGKPEEELFRQSLDFRPTKVLAGWDGTVYAICQGLYKGAAAFSREGEFLGFFGNNDIDITAAMLLEHFWKSLMNKEQLGRMQRSVSIEFSNFAVDSRGFIYTCTRVTDNSMGEIKRLNAKGINVLPVEDYGDLEDVWIKNEHQDTAFVDILAMNDRVIAALDSQRGRVFLYSSDGTLLLIFGDTGRFAGTFRTPSALECIGNHLYVLDPYKDSITRFSPTEYGAALLEASSLYQEGRYTESVDLWNQVMRQNGNFETAYIGIGKALMGAENYSEAMTYFQKGQDRESYSQAYEEYRKTRTSSLVAPVMAGFAVLLLLLFLYVHFFKGPKRERNLAEASLPVRCRHTLLHPTDGYAALLSAPRRRVGILSSALVFCLFGTAVLSRQATGFIFNPHKLEDLDIRLIFASTVVVFLAFVISNRLVCTLFNGNGAVWEIVCVSSVALIPALAAVLFKTLLSHFLSAGEGGFLTVLVWGGIAWSALLLLAGMKLIHEYDGKQAVLSVIFTGVGMLLMAFIALLVWGLYNQIGAFFSTIIDEISYMRLT